MEITSPDQEIIYVGDPMCSWCWGIAPELDELSRQRSDLPFRIVLGGLRPGADAAVVDDRMAASLAHHWEEVGTRSRQPFDHLLLDQRGWLYDTEPACRAVVVMRELDEELAWPLFKRLQHLFYAEGVMLSDPAVYRSIVADFAVDVDDFVAAFDSNTAVTQTWQDFAAARKWGITGFPTVFVRDGEKGHLLARGYTTADRMLGALEQVIPAVGGMCGPDGVC